MRRRLLAVIGLLMFSGGHALAAQQHLFLNDAWSASYAKINCEAEAWKRTYPCNTGDPAFEVRALLDRVRNYMTADPACHGIHLENNGSGGSWDLSVEISFVDKTEATRWILLGPHSPEGVPVGAWHGSDKPEAVAHLACGIVSHAGTETALGADK